MKLKTFRFVQSFLSLITLLVLLAAYFFEFYQGLLPCPLCMMQRFCVFIVFMFGFSGLMLKRMRRAHLIALFQVLFSFAGLYFALRQLWLQSLPPESVAACMPTLDILFKYFPWQSVVNALLWGSGDCAEVPWTFLGLSMPGWAAVYFLFIGSSAFVLWYKTRLIRYQ